MITEKEGRKKIKNKYIAINKFRSSIVIGSDDSHEKNNIKIFKISLQSPFGDFNDQV